MKIFTRKTSRTPEQRRMINARYYERVKKDPQLYARRKRAQRNHKRRNSLDVKLKAIEYYERNRAEVIFKVRLERMLANVRRGEIARGRIPYDG